ncbi:MAG TPA: HEAT repeat domain-containing protein, partial [Polyangia bacterium]
MAESSAWDRFVASLERGVTSREDLESLDLAALRQFDDVQRERARQLLTAKLSDGDPRIVDALAELDTPKAWTDVERAFTSSWGSAQVHAAMWLWMRRRDPRVVPQLRSLALSNPKAPTLVTEIVLALERIDTNEADDAMVEILATTNDAGVTSSTTDRIFVRHSWDQWDNPGAPIFTMRCGLTSIFPSVRAKALDELRALIAEQRAGKSDVQLGIDSKGVQQRSPAMQQVFATAVDANAPIPPDATLDQLQGGERDWGIDMLLGRLERGEARVLPGVQ